MGISEKAIVAQEEIEAYIPQRTPIVMVDEFYGVQENRSEAGLLILPENFFCEEGKLSECGVLEHIAQSAAMRVGYISKQQGKEIPLGYIGAINKFKIEQLPLVGQRLRTEIVIDQEIMNISLVAARTKVGDPLIA